MRKRIPLLVRVGVLLVAGVLLPRAGVAGEAAPLRLGWHYAGYERIAAATDGTLFRKALTQPATQKLLANLADRLATAPQRLAGGWLKDPSAKIAPKLRAMIVDLATRPSYGEWRSAGGGCGEWALLVQVDAATAQRWAADWPVLARAFGAGAAEPVAGAQGDLRIARCADGSLATALSTSADTVAVAGGADPGGLLAGLAAKVRAEKRDDAGAWLTLESDLAEATGQPGLPRVELAVTGRHERIKAAAKLHFAQEVAPRLDDWNIPTNLIREPLISFAAARGVAGLLGHLPWMQRTGLKPVPNQLFTWGLGIHPSQNYLAFPNDDPAGALQAAREGLSAEFDRQFPFLAPAELQYRPDKQGLVVTNLIMAAAFLMPAPETAPGFIVGGVSLPLDLRGREAPGASLEQVRTLPTLRYYQWELTQPRIEMLWHAATYWTMMHAYLPPPPGGAFTGLLRDKGFTSCLGNTVTQVTLESPHEIQVVRSSAVGFTAYELIKLAQWIDGKNWPAKTKPIAVQEYFRNRKKAAGQAAPGRSGRKQPKPPAAAPRRVTPKPPARH